MSIVNSWPAVTPAGVPCTPTSIACAGFAPISKRPAATPAHTLNIVLRMIVFLSLEFLLCV
jgi:hypothetical protein